jgi:hypothetical protein
LPIQPKDPIEIYWEAARPTKPETITGGVRPNPIMSTNAAPNTDGTTPAAPSPPNSFDWQKYVENFDAIYKQVGEVVRVFSDQPGQTQSPTSIAPRPAPQPKPKGDRSWFWLVAAAVGVYYATR